MKVNPAQFNESLKKAILPVYILSGDEPFQKEEYSREIKVLALKSGFNEQLVYHADAQFDWENLKEAATSLSLFSDKRLIELRFPLENKISPEAESALRFYAKYQSSNNILLLVCHKVSKSVENSVWFKKLESAGLWLPLWQIEGKKLTAWISNRIRQHGMTIAQEATILLAERVEGNLLAAAQEIEKLRLLTNDGTITRQHVIDLVSHSAHFNVFNLSEAIIAGNTRHALSIYRTLCSEGVDITIILWAVARELRILNHLSYLIDKRCLLDTAIEQTAKELGLPAFSLKRRRHDYLGCVNRLGKKNIQHLIYNAATLDSKMKTGENKNTSNQLLALILKVCGIDIGGVFMR